MNRLAKKIKDERIKAGLTENELAKKCGLSVSYILQIESGKKIVNEKVADGILKSLGTKEEFISEEKVVKKQEKKTVKGTSQNIIVEPNQTWTSALAGVIEKYPIIDISNNKVVDYKELPIIGKKVEGHKPDKLMFYKCANDNMKYFRIRKGDILTILKTSDIKNQGLYLVEVKKKKMIRQLVKESGKKVKLLKSSNDENVVIVSQKDIIILGKVIKNEFVI